MYHLHSLETMVPYRTKNLNSIVLCTLSFDVLSLLKVGAMFALTMLFMPAHHFTPSTGAVIKTIVSGAGKRQIQALCITVHAAH